MSPIYILTDTEPHPKIILGKFLDNIVASLRPVFRIVVLVGLISVVVVVIILLHIVVIVCTGDHLFEIGLQLEKIFKCKKRKKSAILRYEIF